MVIVALDGGCGLLETDVIEAGEGGATYVFDSVVWNEELLLREQEETEWWLLKGPMKRDKE